jgi:hypothetical protein
MAPLIALILSIGLTTTFGIFALLLGEDSRPSIGDDHAR